MRTLTSMDEDELYRAAKELQAPYELVAWVAEHGKLPVVNFSAGGIATPADAALMMHLGAEGVFVGSGIFKSDDPASRAKAIVEATTHYQDPAILARVSRGLKDAMPGLEIGTIGKENLIQHRGAGERLDKSPAWRPRSAGRVPGARIDTAPSGGDALARSGCPSTSTVSTG